METPLRILHLEDNESDGELVALALRKAGVACAIERVETKEKFVAALDGVYDMILSDFSLPGFDGLSALTMVRESDVETPFLFVSGTIGEERAVESLRRGATDYILKDRLSRLTEAVRRALAERSEREARRAAEERIREQAALLDQAREAISVKDLAGRVTYWNQGAERLYGWSAAEAVAGAADVRIPDAARKEVTAAWGAVLATGVWDGTLTFAARDGRELVVEAHWTCLRRADGTPRAVMSVEADVTQARSLEQQLLRAQRLETVGMIAGGVAHDLNNVLAPILIAVTTIKRRVQEDSVQRLLNIIEVGVERGSDIVGQVLAFARGSRGAAMSFAAGDMIRGIEKLLLAALPRTVELKRRIPDDLWRVAGDVTQLQQVLLNLCVNARDAMPQGGTLALEADNVVLTGEHAGPHVRIRVADTGQGMPPEIRKKVFEPFYTTKAQGTGIGLAMVASIVRAHGGFIELDSAPGQGTEFRIFLPREPAGEVKPLTSAAPPRPRGEGGLVLVVEEISLREILKGTLEAYGYRVVCAGDMAEALALHRARSAEIEAVLVNFSLPGIDAPDLVRRLVEEDPDVKVVNTSGASESAGAPRAVRATLPKPYATETLLQVMAQVLAGH